MRNQRPWTFHVEVETIPGEVVGVTGSCEELGEWKLSNKVVLLTKQMPSGQDEPETWSTTTWIPACVDVNYRYYVCVVVDTDNYIVRRRETSLLPRRIPTDVMSTSAVDRFGWAGTEEGGGVKVDRGWLTAETVIQFKLYGSAIRFWKEKLKTKKPYVKLTPVSLTRRAGGDVSTEVLDNSLSVDTQDNGELSQVWPITEAAALHETDAALQQQSQFGMEFDEEQSNVLFQVQVHYPETVAYMIDLYMYSSRAEPHDPPSHIGFSHILPDTMAASEGYLVVPITSTRHRPIGQLSVYYVVIKPIPDYHCSMDVSYAKHWKHNVLGLDVGHRGLGPSFKQKSCAELRENTIASLKEAASHGADFVEFDVQLSKDLVPVIYHDFHVAISLKRKNLTTEDRLEIPLKELTMEQLQSLKDLSPRSKYSKVLVPCCRDPVTGLVYHVLEDKNQKVLFDEHLEEHQPFPTLKHALEVLDPAVGFNIEIKWTMLLKDGTFELNNPFNINTYLDCVLKVVLEHGGSRKIVFSCFHPDICTIIRYKQPKYPVIFLTQGMTSRYPMYHDPRCHTVPAAINFALACGLLGINVHTEDILRDPSLVQYTKERGMVMFCWGDENNCPATIQYLKKLGLHAVIYDKINEFGPKRLSDSLYTAQKAHRAELIHLADNIHAANAPSGAAPTNGSVTEPLTQIPTNLVTTSD